MAKNDSFLHQKVESKLKQVIFGDLISDKLGLLYKNHTQKSVELIKNSSVELNLSNLDTKVLLASAYGLHWGCVNLFACSESHPKNPFQHRAGCLRLASSKLERFLQYHSSRDFSQKEIFQVVKIIEDQNLESFDEDALSLMLFEVTAISWAKMIANQELLGVSGQLKNELIMIGKDYLKKERTKLKSELSKQVIQNIL